MTFDEAALSIMLGKGSPAAKQAALGRLSAYAEVAHGDRCPECGSADCQSNSARHDSDLVFLCDNCGHQWMPSEMGDTLENVTGRDW